MIYTELTKKAMKYLFLVQGAQKDLSGIPYVFHPWHLAETMEDELSTTVALRTRITGSTSSGWQTIRWQER